MRNLDDCLAGVPAQSPDISPLDNTAFSVLQSDCSKEIIKKQENNELEHFPNFELTKIVQKKWRSKKYKNLTKKGINHIEKVMREIVRRRGDMTQY